jgi:hypothetical protein
MGGFSESVLAVLANTLNQGFLIMLTPMLSWWYLLTPVDYAAAAPEGGALAGPSASPHLPVVGAGNPVAVPGLAR